MINKIKTWIYTKRIINSGGISSSVGANIVQEDSRSHEAVKRLRKSFDQQAQSMHIRSLKRHGSHCTDPGFCVRRNCFKWEPDKIVDTTTVAVKTKEERINELSERIARNKID